MSTAAPFMLLTAILVIPVAAIVLLAVWALCRSNAPVIGLGVFYTIALVAIPGLAIADVEPLDLDCPTDAHECYQDSDAALYWLGGAFLSGLATATVISWGFATRPGPSSEAHSA